MPGINAGFGLELRIFIFSFFISISLFPPFRVDTYPVAIDLSSEANFMLKNPFGTTDLCGDDA